MNEDLTGITRQALKDHIECLTRVAEVQVGEIVSIAENLAEVLLASGPVGSELPGDTAVWLAV